MTQLIIDGGSIYARCFYAGAKSEKLAQLEDDIGTSFVEIGAKMMLGLLDPHGTKIGERIDQMLFCWDGQPKRDKQRPNKPLGYKDGQKQFIQAMKDLFGGVHCCPPQHEADDAVATHIYKASDHERIYVVSGDHDLQQLAAPNVLIYDLNCGAVLSRKFILDRWNVLRPCQICIALAVLGDSGDNVPGIRGWGPKKVKELFKVVTPEMNLEEALQAIVK